MKIKWGAMVTEGRGKLGGHVASRGKGADVFFTKPRAVNRQTTYQSGQRAIFAQLSREWSQLTAAQIRGWNDAVELFRYTNIFGDSRSLSGKALFQQLNSNLILSNQSTISVAPVPAPVNIVPIVSATISSASGNIGVNFSSSLPNQTVLIYATPVVSNGTTYVADNYFFVNTGTTNASGFVGSISGWSARHGLPVMGQRIFVAARSVNSVGQVSPRVQLILNIS